MSDVRPTNGLRAGDVSHISLAVADLAAATTFLSGLFGWELDAHGLGLEVTPQVGLWNGDLGDGRTLRGVVLSYRVDDLAAAVAEVAELGGTATPPAARPYGLESTCADDQGTVFFLHQLDDNPIDDGTDLANGRRHGDVAYLTITTASVHQAEAFYGSLLGWTTTPGSVEHGRQIEGIRPMAGFAQGEPQVIASYRVDDIEEAAARVVELGGQVGPIEDRPYGRSMDRCLDDQGLPFGLIQLI